MKSLEELRAIREKMQGKVGIRGESEDQIRVVVGMATCGIASGARPVLTALSDAVQEQGLMNINVTQTGCIGLCHRVPEQDVLSFLSAQSVWSDPGTDSSLRRNSHCDRPFVRLGNESPCK